MVLVAAAALLVLSAAVHLHLWSVGYRAIPSIGPLFLAQGIATPVVAVLLVLTRRLAAVAVALPTMVGTVAGFLLADTVGLFGFHDGFAAPYAATAFVIEVSRDHAPCHWSGADPARVAARANQAQRRHHCRRDARRRPLVRCRE